MYLNAHEKQGAALDQLKNMVRVYLDGIEVHDVISLDTRAGWIQQYRRNAAGHLIRFEDDAAIQTVQGYVSVRFK